MVSTTTSNLRSAYGHAETGALAPIEELHEGINKLHPLFESVLFDRAAVPLGSNVSPAVDLGSPAFDFTIEPTTISVGPGFIPIQNGQVINAGAYGNTVQASATPR